MRLLLLSLRELLNSKSFAALFILNLSLGLVGLVALDGFKSSIENEVNSQSRSLLGGDLSVSARRPLTQAELDRVDGELPAQTPRAEVIEMFSMLATDKGRSRLVQIRAIGEGYPFYGKIAASGKTSQDPLTFQSLNEGPNIWIYPELQNQLGVAVGEVVQIGSGRFKLAGLVQEDVATGITANMAPRVYLGLSQLSQTKLVQKGTIAWHSHIFHLPNVTEGQLSQLREQIFASLDNPDVRVSTHQNTSDSSATLVSRLGDFLGLSSLVGLFLASVGSGFLFQAYFRRRRKQVAILIALGASRLQAFVYYLLQLLSLSLASVFVAYLGSLVVIPLLIRLTQGLLPLDVQFSMSWLSLLLGLALAVVGSLTIGLPTLLEIHMVRPQVLLRESQSTRKSFSWRLTLAFIPALLLLTSLSVWFARSYWIGLLFTAGCVVASAVLAIVGLVLFIALGALPLGALHWRWAFRDINRYRRVFLVCFVSLGLGSLLLNLTPQVRTALASELKHPQTSKLPSFFLFDIQEEQLEPLTQLLNNYGLSLQSTSPMIQSRLLSVNGDDFSKGSGSTSQFSREEQSEMRFRNRGFNLSYRPELSHSETLVEGRAFSGVYEEGSGQLPEISVEARFAERLGLKMGDRLKFDIEGVEIEGEIINLRRVQWTSFQPNFFIQFQPGVLEIAPKVFIATLPGLSSEMKEKVQDGLVESLPNISLIDVGRVVEQLLSMMDQMSWAMFLMSVLCLFAGIVVLYSIANHQSEERSWDIRLLKALGSPYSLIRKTFVYQFLIVAISGAFVGVLLSIAFSFAISTYIFEGVWVLDIKTPVLTLLMAALITWLVIERATRSALKKKVVLGDQ